MPLLMKINKLVMEEIKKFTLQVLPAEKDELHPAHSKLLFEEKLTRLELEGVSLDAQYQYQDKYLLFLTHDSPFADTLHIYLISESYEKIDEWAISCLRESEWFMLRNLKITKDNQIRFSFYGDDSWLLTVLEKPQLTLPKLPLFSMSWKPLRFAFTPGYL